jgi:hypothetical protein
VNWAEFKEDKSWVKHVVYPVSSSELDRLAELSRDPKCHYNIGWSMGELHCMPKQTMIMRAGP